MLKDLCDEHAVCIADNHEVKLRRRGQLPDSLQHSIIFVHFVGLQASSSKKNS